MDKEGYDRPFTAALIASASTIANLIPPSIMAIVYGAYGDVSIGGLFLGGVVPGLLVGAGIMIYTRFYGPPGVKRPRATFGQLSDAAKASALTMMIPLIIMGGILTGRFTPTEAGVVAAAFIVFYILPLNNRGLGSALLPMLLVVVYLMREEVVRLMPASKWLLAGETAPWLPLPILAVIAAAYVLYALTAWGGFRHVKALPRDFANAGLIFAIPLSAVAAASAFAWLLARLKGPDVVAGWIGDFAGPNPLIIMFLLVLLFVIVGDFIDAVPAIIIFLPIIRALTELGGIHPVHMGVTIVVTLAFGLITPPYGISLLMASKFVGVSFGRAVLRSLPFYLVFFVTILFCIFLPEVVLWLPKKLIPESVGCFKAPDGGGYICPPITMLFR
jgi:TRAP-type C4-dicarboxylate transport system permease large subunit